MAIPSFKLSSGHDMPAFGLGTWKSKPGEVTASVKDAIDAGYRLIDGALCYQNENEVGEAINAKIKEGVVKREDLFVTSKLWNTFHRPDLVAVGLKQTLSDLKLDYLDLYLIHWPVSYLEDQGTLFPKNADGSFLNSKSDLVECWKAMEGLVKQGLVRSIGVSNFNSQQVDRILANCTIKPVTNQIECHPYLNQSKLIEFCKARGIVITAYSPLGSPDRPWAKPTDPVLLADPKLVAYAKKLGKSPAQVVLRWGIQRGTIVIPKSVTKSRIIENVSIFDFELAQEDMDYINGLDCNGRGCPELDAKTHPDWPFNIEF